MSIYWNEIQDFSLFVDVLSDVETNEWFRIADSLLIRIVLLLIANEDEENYYWFARKGHKHEINKQVKVCIQLLCVSSILGRVQIFSVYCFRWSLRNAVHVYTIHPIHYYSFCTSLNFRSTAVFSPKMTQQTE